MGYLLADYSLLDDQSITFTITIRTNFEIVKLGFEFEN
jgi:hypothetical protein